MPTQAESESILEYNKRTAEQDRKEVEEMDKAINALIESGTVQYWTVLGRMLTAKYLRRLAIAWEKMGS